MIVWTRGDMHNGIMWLDNDGCRYFIDDGQRPEWLDMLKIETEGVIDGWMILE